MLPHDVFRQGADLVQHGDAAGLQDRETLRHVADELQVLLDQQDRAAPLAMDSLDDVVDLLDDGRLQPFRRLVEQEQPRLLHQRAGDGQLLLLDEPTTGMTDEGKHRTAELIRRIAQSHTVLLVEHDMHVVRQIAEKVTVLHQGQRLAEGPLAEVVQDETVRAVYLGKGKFG